MVDIRKSTIDELATLLGGGGVSAVELLNNYIQAIQSEDEDYNAIAFLNPDAEKIALELDNERRNGFVRGPLHGIPILLKDNIDTADKTFIMMVMNIHSCHWILHVCRRFNRFTCSKMF